MKNQPIPKLVQDTGKSDGKAEMSVSLGQSSVCRVFDRCLLSFLARQIHYTFAIAGYGKREWELLQPCTLEVIGKRLRASFGKGYEPIVKIFSMSCFNAAVFMLLPHQFKAFPKNEIP